MIPIAEKTLPEKYSLSPPKAMRSNYLTHLFKMTNIISISYFIKKHKHYFVCYVDFTGKIWYHINAVNF